MLHSSITSVPFLISINFLGERLFLKIRKIDVFVAQNKKNDNPRKPYRRTCNFTSFGVCWLRFTLKSYIPEAFEWWPFFDQKLRDMTSLKRHFLKNFSTELSEIVFDDAKLMLNKVL